MTAIGGSSSKNQLPQRGLYIRDGKKESDKIGRSSRKQTLCGIVGAQSVPPSLSKGENLG